MNFAHLHLIVNHFPIIGTVIGFVILTAGLISKNKSVQNTAYFIFVASMLFTAVSMATGDGAEDMLENLPNGNKELIHIHENYADIMSVAVYILGCFSILGLVLNYFETKNSEFVGYIATLLTIICIYLGCKVGISGGEITHTEIRTTTTNAKIHHEGEGKHHHHYDGEDED